MRGKWKKVLSLLLIWIMLLSVVQPVFAANKSSITREELYKRIRETVDYYHKTYKEYSYAGILDWPALGLSAMGEDVSGPKWTINGKNGPYWREEQVKTGAGLSKVKNTDYQRTIIGVTSAGKDPRDFGGHNLVETVKGTMMKNGHFADSVADNLTGKPVGETLINAHIFGIIALHVAGEPIPNRDKCLEWLIKQQHIDGGFTWDVKYFDDPEDYKRVVSDVDMTAGGLMAFAILGEDLSQPHVKRAWDFLKEEQLEHGGFHSWGTDNPESCAWVIKALTLFGVDPMGPEWTKPSGGNPVASILRFQQADGSFSHVLNEEDNLPVYSNGMATEQSLYGLADAYNNKAAYDILHEKYKPTAVEHVFKDFEPQDKGFKEALALAYDYIMLIDDEGKFHPVEPIKKEELERALKRMQDLGYKIETVDFSSYKTEITGENFVEILSKAIGIENSIEALKGKGLIYQGFDKDRAVTKAEAAISLYALKESKSAM
ncbi:Prenyltransferase and squalene oxidase repeat-containing protein [Anaerovirgula multivorans]|uniref:Prenyltransferase and squalene oxidase repeat-containing protein n=1 Tax=Anaerovirgula multivorans TaxID=312168 RepID=A0A239C9S4_9FIRM|nr:prenyltransferase/squalene oxidase repeat-containing protein [Anaerovirgula multivorans]SNS16642.1 Prenyltransferase and squalene oxidase repeat-containing protein [Anaerovirgula multivorans]